MSGLLLISTVGIFGCVDARNIPSYNAPDTPTQSPDQGYQGTALILTGPGIWKDEVSAIEALLIARGAGYREVAPAQLEAMPLEEIAKYNLLVIAGGDAPSITASVNAETRARVRQAIQNNGMNYIGFCAGAWLAVAPAPPPGHDVVFGFGIVEGPVQQRSTLEARGFKRTMTPTLLPNGSRTPLLWYGGPITPDIPGGVIAKYSDGTPAITQLWSGRGFVILSALHPAVSQDLIEWLGLPRRQTESFDFAWSLLNAAFKKHPMPTF